MAWWTSPAVDERIRTLHAEGKSAQGTANILTVESGHPITKGMIISRRRRVGIKPGGSLAFFSREFPELTPVETVPTWKSPECDGLFIKDWMRGVPIKGLAARWHVSEETIAKHRKQLGLTPRHNGEFVPYVPRDQSNRPSRAKVVEPAVKAEPTAKPVVLKAEPPPRQQQSRMASVNGRGASLFGRRDLGLLAHLPQVVPRAPCACQWPLACDAPTTGRWCVEHALLIKRAA